MQVFADVRGNQDTFNIPLRGGAKDRYATYGLSLPELRFGRAVVRDLVSTDGVPLHCCTHGNFAFMLLRAD